MPSVATVSMDSSAVSRLESQLRDRTQVMTQHPVFAQVRDFDDLRLFMRWHVFAVWDFMSLVKRLQSAYTCTTLPWTPPGNVRAARLITEIVLGEECDLAPGGGHASHYDLYLMAMREMGADDSQVLRFVDLVRAGESVSQALVKVGVPAAVSRFVSSTIDTAIRGSTLQVLGSFLYGREDVIPRMFRKLLADWAIRPEDTPIFVYYLERHIELDSESHGPAAASLIEDAIDGDAQRREEILRAALKAVEHRIELWDGLEAAIVQARTKSKG